MYFSKSIALACFVHVITAEYIDCTNYTCSDTNIECSNNNLTTCTIDCIGDFACAGSIIYGGSGDLVLNCDGNAACDRAVLYCPDDHICNISIPNGAVPTFVYASSSSELLVTVSEDLRPTLSTIHCPLTSTFEEINFYPCTIRIDGENGDDCCGNDAYHIYSIDDAVIECLNPPCHSHPRNIHMDKTHAYKSICVLEPESGTQGFYWEKNCFDIDVAEGEQCTSDTEGYDLETIEMTEVSNDGKYFYFDNAWCNANAALYDLRYEQTGEWIPVVISEGVCYGNVKMQTYPRRAAAAGDWELGSFRRLRYDTSHYSDSCGYGLQCDESSSTCQSITTPSPTDNSANRYSFLFPIFVCLFCFIL